MSGVKDLDLDGRFIHQHNTPAIFIHLRERIKVSSLTGCSRFKFLVWLVIIEYEDDFHLKR